MRIAFNIIKSPVEHEANAVGLEQGSSGPLEIRRDDSFRQSRPEAGSGSGRRWRSISFLPFECETVTI